MLAVIVAGSVLLLETRYASLVFGAFWLIGATEWARLAGFTGIGRAAYAAVFAAFVIGVLGLGLPGGVAEAVFLIAAAGWFCAFVYVLRYPRQLARLPIAAFGLVALAAAWLAFHNVHGAGAEGPALILTGLVIVWSADIGAFFVGRTLGHRPLAPRVSPKKTWEGVGGGVALAAAAGAISAWLLGRPLAALVPVAAAMALISIVGDLGVSLLKRRAGLKDSGMLLPGHGGILDRFDGVTAALPFFVLGLQFAHVLD